MKIYLTTGHVPFGPECILYVGTDKEAAIKAFDGSDLEGEDFKGWFDRIRVMEVEDGTSSTPGHLCCLDNKDGNVVIAEKEN